MSNHSKDRSLPKLNCSIGDKLIVKKEIIFDDFTIYPDDYCIVDGIVGYGIDLKTSKGIDIRILNSQIPIYFKTIENE